MRSSWTNIHNIILKLCLNPNYKQVLGELSQPVITGSTPGHRVRRIVAHKGSSLLGSVQQSSSVRGKRHIYNTCSIWCTKFRHRLHDDHKGVICTRHWPVLRYGPRGKILRTLFCTLGLMTWCHESLHLEKIPSWSRLKRAHYVSKPFDLLEITITFLLQLRKFW